MTGTEYKEIYLGPKKKRIPKDWKLSTIYDLTVEDDFAIVDGPFGTQLHADEYVEDGLPLVRISNLSFEGVFLHEDLENLTEEKIEELERSKVTPGDIIIAKTGATIGKSAIFPERYEKGLIASSCLKVSINSDKADNNFVHYWIMSPIGQSLINLFSSGSTRSSINIGPFGNIKIPEPPLPEQRRIAEILSTVDEAIQQTDEIIETSKELKKGLMQDLLTKGIGHDEFKEVQLGPRKEEIPESWNAIKIQKAMDEDYIEVQQDGNHGSDYPRKDEFVEEGTPYISANSLENNEVDFSQAKYLGDEKVEDLRKGFARDGDVLLAHNATVGKTGILRTEEDTVILGTSLTLYRCNEGKLDNNYLLYFFESTKFQKQLEMIMGQSTRNQVPITRQRTLSLLLPPPDEQREIAERLSVVDEKVRQEEEYREKLEELKKGLMQDLLTGKKRVEA